MPSLSLSAGRPILPFTNIASAFNASLPSSVATGNRRLVGMRPHVFAGIMQSSITMEAQDGSILSGDRTVADGHDHFIRGTATCACRAGIVAASIGAYSDDHAATPGRVCRA